MNHVTASSSLKSNLRGLAQNSLQLYLESNELKKNELGIVTTIVAFIYRMVHKPMKLNRKIFHPIW